MPDRPDDWTGPWPTGDDWWTGRLPPSDDPAMAVLVSTASGVVVARRETSSAGWHYDDGGLDTFVAGAHLWAYPPILRTSMGYDAFCAFRGDTPDPELLGSTVHIYEWRDGRSEAHVDGDGVD